MKIATVGIDLAKSVFQVHGVSERGKALPMGKGIGNRSCLTRQRSKQPGLLRRAGRAFLPDPPFRKICCEKEVRFASEEQPLWRETTGAIRRLRARPARDRVSVSLVVSFRLFAAASPETKC